MENARQGDIGNTKVCSGACLHSNVLSLLNLSLVQLHTHTHTQQLCLRGSSVRCCRVSPSFETSNFVHVVDCSDSFTLSSSPAYTYMYMYIHTYTSGACDMVCNCRVVLKKHILLMWCSRCSIFDVHSIPVLFMSWRR